MKSLEKIGDLMNKKPHLQKMRTGQWACCVLDGGKYSRIYYGDSPMEAYEKLANCRDKLQEIGVDQMDTNRNRLIGRGVYE